MNQRQSSFIGFIGSAVAALMAAVAMSGNARAEGPIGESSPFVSSLSRDQVKADLMKNRALVTAYASEWALQQNSTLVPTSAVTRAQVRAEYIAARDEVRAMTGEDSGSRYMAQAPMPLPVTTVAGSHLR